MTNKSFIMFTIFFKIINQKSLSEKKARSSGKMIVCFKILFTFVFLLAQFLSNQIVFRFYFAINSSVSHGKPSVKKTFVFMIDGLSILRDTPPEQVELSSEVIQMHSYRLGIKLAPPNTLFLYIDYIPHASSLASVKVRITTWILNKGLKKDTQETTKRLNRLSKNRLVSNFEILQDYN